jgi:hypothetical protein
MRPRKETGEGRRDKGKGKEEGEMKGKNRKMRRNTKIRRER